MKLFKHQEKIIKDNPKYHGLWWECSTGKTLASILLAEKNCKKPLVVCIKSLRENWEREIKKWKTDDREWKVVTKEEHRKDWAALLKEGYDGIILDESHFHGGYQSAMHKNMVKYLKKAKPKCVYLLTATPYSNPMNVMAMERLLGRKASFFDYRQRFYNMVYMGARQVPVVKDGIDEELQSILRELGSVVKLDDVIDLPEFIFHREDFSLTPEQNKILERIDEDPLVTSPIVRFTYFHRLCGGMYMNERRMIHSVKNEKIERLRDYAKEHKKFIVVCRYNEELEMIKREIGDRVQVINGETKDNDARRMEADKSEDTILAINSTMSEGYNLTGYNMTIFYSHDFQYKNFYQMCRRTRRVGQKHPCTIVSFVVKDSPDEAVYNCLDTKSDFYIELYCKE